MFSRTVGPIIRGLSRYGESASARVRAYHEPAHYKPASMNDVPIPQGSWEAYYSSKQKKHNLQLLIGIAFAALTLTVTINSGLMTLNYSIPKQTEVKEEQKE